MLNPELSPPPSEARHAVEDPSQEWVTLAEAAEITGLHIDTVRARARRGVMPARKDRTGSWLVQLPDEPLDSPASIERELAKLYRDVAAGKLTALEGKRRAGILAAISTASEKTSLERRLQKLEAVEESRRRGTRR